MAAGSLVREVRSTDSDYVVFLNSAKAPTDAEWEEAMRIYRGIHQRRGFTHLKVFVVTDGGGPNTRQRGLFNTLANGQPYPAAIIMNNMLARGIITAFSFFNPKIRAFAPSNAAEACRHVDAKLPEIKLIGNALAEMGKEMPSELLQEVLWGMQAMTNEPAATANAGGRR